MEANTLSQTLNDLKAEGYIEDFNLEQNCLVCRSNDYKLFAEDFHVDKFFRFEGETDPGDEAIVYAISSAKMKIKGVLVNGYGIYSESLTDEMLNKLTIQPTS